MRPEIDTTGLHFHPVIHLPSAYEVYDFSQGYDPDRTLSHAYGIGRYDEHRPGMYAGEQFQGVRNIHMGIDIGCPAGEPVHAFFEGTIYKLGDNALAYDYGPTLITRHELNHETVFALHGHLGRAVLKRWSVGDSFGSGDILATVGQKHENGGWNPHLHFQLSRVAPKTHDMPGAVSKACRTQALLDYPDPRLVLGALY
jgi:murein DD-endopeptidase MepM/ murein hydrolase activator NlpD